MITIHHLSNSHSHVILWLMEELGLDYAIVPHQRDPRTGLSPDTLRAIHPAAKAPAIEDGGAVMIESTGILLYLLETYGGGLLRPAPGTADAMAFFQWLTYVEGSAKAPVMAMARLRRRPDDDRAKIAAQAQADKHLKLIDAALADRETLIPGLFTAADIQLTFFEELAEAIGQLEPFPNMTAHLARMRRRDAYRRAEAKGGPVGLTQLFNRLPG